MATTENTWNVSNRIHSNKDSDNPEVNHIITGADEIYDDSQGRKQNEVNTDVARHESEINDPTDGLQKRVEDIEAMSQIGDTPVETNAGNIINDTSLSGKVASASAVNGVYNALDAQTGYYTCGTAEGEAAKTVDAPGFVLSRGGSIKIKMTNANSANNATLDINSTGAKALYYDGEGVSANNSWKAGETVEVYYDGTNFYANNVAGGSGSGDGAFDVSAKYPTSGVEGGNTYTLEGALAVLNANLSANKKKGGMQIRFVQSIDDKYVQWRYMGTSIADTDFTNVVNWQGVDMEPDQGSRNLVESDGVVKLVSGNGSNNTYPVKYGFIAGYTTRETNIICGTNLTLIKGHRYKCIIRSQSSFTPSGDFNLKIMDSSSFATVYRIATLVHVPITKNEYIFTWEEDSVDDYRMGFYGAITNAPRLEVFLFDITIESLQDEIKDINSRFNPFNCDFFPYKYKPVNITPSTIIIFEGSRICYGQDNVYRVPSDMTINRNTAQNQEVIVFDSSNNTLKAVYDYSGGSGTSFRLTSTQFVLFSVWKGTNGCSLSPDYVIFNNEKRTDFCLANLKFIDNVGLDIANGNYRQNTGAITCEYYFKMQVFHKVYLSSTEQGLNFLASTVAWYDADKNFIRRTTNYAVEKEYTAPENAVYFRIAFLLRDDQGAYLEELSKYRANYDFDDVFMFVNSNAFSVYGDKVLYDILDPDAESIFTYNKKDEIINKLVQLKSVQDGNNQVHTNTTSLANTDSMLTLLHFSDIHADDNNLARIVEFWNTYKNDYISDIIHTGDTAWSQIDDSHSVPMLFEKVAGAERILNVVGNHDAWLMGTSWYQATGKQSYDYILKGTGEIPLVDNWGVTQPVNAEANGLCYYYKDYPSKSIRLIVLDCMHNDNAQETWFTGLLNETLTEGNTAYGYNVIVAVHYQSQYGLTAKDTTFNCLDGNVPAIIKSNYPSPNTDVADIPDITGTYHVERFPNRMYQKVDTFINNGGKFICWLCGHTHKDFFGNVTGFTNQLQITIDTANRTKGDNYNWESRINHTQSCDCFNVVGFDTLHKVIKIVRVGVNRDSRMRLIDTMCYDYQNGTVISNN